MKKWFVVLTLTLASILSSGVMAQITQDVSDELKNRIVKLSTFEAHFSQKVIDTDGKTIMQGNGRVLLSHPALIRWHALTPDENLMISDGQTLWIYNIDLEQVTATDASQAIDSTPFALLASSDATLWDKYLVSKQDDGYVIKPKIQSGQVSRLLLYFNGEQFSRLVIEDISKQRSEFMFDQVVANKPMAKSLFTFTVPTGVELDDQRN